MSAYISATSLLYAFAAVEMFFAMRSFTKRGRLGEVPSAHLAPAAGKL